MIRFVLRFLGLWILAAAFVFFIYDGTKTIASGSIWPPYITRVGDVWFNVHQKSLEQLQPIVEQRVGGWLWHDGIQPFFLNLPAWLVLGILAVLMVLLGRKKKPLIGYARD